jgi:thiol-disulfide isomerase/thioredoxin
MLTWILEFNGYKPGYLIGGVPLNFTVSARLGESKYFVIEADEYDTAFFANPWQTPDGKSINPAQWQGKVLVVNFWASWCPPCIEEMPTLDLLSQEFLQQNVLFVGIGIDSPSNIREFLKSTPILFRFLNAVN